MLTNNYGYTQDPSDLLNNSVEKAKNNDKDSLKTILKVNKDVGTKTTTAVSDSIVNDSISKPRKFLDGIIDYKAKDYTSINQKTKEIYLYNQAQILYRDMDIKAGVIVIDYANDLVYAEDKDSLELFSSAVFKQALIS